MTFLDTVIVRTPRGGITLDKNLVYYFAMPYSHPNQYVKEERYLRGLQVSASLIEAGFILIDPIASCHQQSQRFGLPSGYEYWKRRDRALIEKSDALLVLWGNGVKESVGVNDEVQYALSLGKRVFILLSSIDGAYIIHGEIIKEDTNV